MFWGQLLFLYKWSQNKCCSVKKDECVNFIEYVGDKSYNVFFEDIFVFDSIFGLLDDVLVNILMLENMLISNINNFCDNLVFNNCIINFCYDKK